MILVNVWRLVVVNARTAAVEAATGVYFGTRAAVDG